MTLQEQTKALARAYNAKADELDTAWLKRADPRAVQGGDFCEAANLLRKVARNLSALARDEDLWVGT